MTGFSNTGSQKQLGWWLISLILLQFMKMLNRFNFTITQNCPFLIPTYLKGKEQDKGIGICRLSYITLFSICRLGNCIWHEQCGLRTSNQTRHSDSIICILWKGQHGEHRVRMLDYFLFPTHILRIKNYPGRTFRTSSFDAWGCCLRDVWSPQLCP